MEKIVVKPANRESTLLATLDTILDHMSKWMAAAVVGGVMMWRWDSEGMWGAMGALANWGLSTVLKKLIGQPRPSPVKKSDPGMPSSHSQSLFYAFTFLTLSVSELVGTNHVTYSLGGVAIYFSSYLSWLRVTQRYHTRNQVVVGALLGTLFCVVWLYAWTVLVSHLFRSFLWVRLVIVLGAVSFSMVLFKITVATFYHRRKTRVTQPGK
ncbi:uncharacterized protein [Phyllobates terribilis]|uniref:uncharacterized protein n=1 Tax=Phyllobates terribilis TaxID=111132 RepID=UPI003CCAB0AE